MKQKKITNNKRAIFAAEGALGLILLVACALFLPNILFRLKDRYLWKDTVLESREPVDVTILSSSYEPDLYERMYHFAQGLAAGTEYYASVQELEITADLYDRLQGESGLRQNFLYKFFVNELLNESIFWDYTIDTWKQYVIYNDNYTQGVDFILWYLEFTVPPGEKVKLLIDAEDMTLYGIRTEGNVLLEQTDRLVRWGSGEYPLYEYLASTGYELPDFWNLISYHYAALTKEDLERYYKQLEYYGYVYTKIPDSAATESITNTRISISSDGNRFDLDIPYGEHSLTFCMEHMSDDSGNHYHYPQLTLGIEPIYKLIPEFQ